MNGNFCSVEPDGDPHEFDEWTSEANVYTTTVDEFIKWSRIPNIEGAKQVLEIQENAERPAEPPDDDDDQRWRSGDYGEYWTVARIFEDL